VELIEPPQIKKRTTAVLPVRLLEELDKLKEELGLSRSALLTVGAVLLIARAAPVLRPGHRADSLAAVDEIVKKLLAEARKDA
jgi:hypothetical protein